MAPERPVRVLQILMCDGIGGTETMVASLVERLDPGQVTSHVTTLSGRGPVAARLADAGVPVASLGRDDGLAGASRRLAGVLSRGRYDVINAYGFKATMISRILTRGVATDARFVCGVRGLHVTEVERLDSSKARIALGLERLGSDLVDVYDANSSGAVELLAGAGIPRTKLRFIPNGLDLDQWPTATLGDPAVPTVLCVARFVPRKRHIDLVRAAEELARRGVAFRLVLGGDGPTRAEVQAAVAAGPAANRIEFPGPIAPTHMPAWLAGADLVALSSLWEGMANGVMEAMACGLPVVGTDVNGIADLVVPGETGLLVPPESPMRLADALEALLGDAGRRRHMGQAARARIASGFTVDGMVAAKAELYRDLVERG